jgi:hypothetical protein
MRIGEGEGKGQKREEKMEVHIGEYLVIEMSMKIES